jgi:hypothetical protein
MYMLPEKDTAVCSKRLPTFVFFLLLVLIPTLWAGSATSTPRAEQIAKAHGYSDKDIRKMLEGEIVSIDTKSGSKKELALDVAMLVSAPPEKLVKYIEDERDWDDDADIIAFHEIESDLSEASFAGLELFPAEAKEAEKLLKVKAGSEFNLSADEIKRFEALRKKFKNQRPDKHPTLLEAINSEYRRILLDRCRLYQQVGLKGIAPYARKGQKPASPKQELLVAARQEKVLADNQPALYRAIINYPHDGMDGTEHSFYWVKKRVQDRPAFILAHQMSLQTSEAALVMYREFYVGHTYNSQQASAGLLPTERGTIVFYGNRTSTDQVAGFASDLAHRIGRDKMRKQVIKHFKTIRADLGGQ